MKTSLMLLVLALFAFNYSEKDFSYTGSTPAAPIVRSFLGISMTDSIDFIRWNLVLSDKHYRLECHYGIGKPNTNGFMDGGKHVKLSGLTRHDDNRYQLINNGRVLSFAQVNSNLLHIMDSNHLLTGTAGWSYVLNNLNPIPSGQTAWTGKNILQRDSVSFVGRTPCGVAGFAYRKDCYKLKWALVFYRSEQATSGRFRLSGSPWYKEGGKKGTWKMVDEGSHRISYLLTDDKGSELARLLALDDNILAFTDASGNLLVGNLDFSYTLNRRW